jgi:chromosome partitioning protein
MFGGDSRAVKILALYNLKGGVGKTAAAVNLAFFAACEGRRTLLWDLDAQGAATFYLRVKPRVKGGAKLLRGNRDLNDVVKPTEHDGLDLLPADFSYRKIDAILDESKKPERRLARILEPLANEYDLVVLDCPPAASLLSEAIFYAADVLLVPVIPTILSLRTLEQIETLVAEAGPHRPSLAPFYSMVDSRRRMHRDLTVEAAGTSRKFLAASIPYSSVVERMGIARAPLPTFAPTHPVSSAFLALWREVRTLLG